MPNTLTPIAFADVLLSIYLRINTSTQNYNYTLKAKIYDVFKNVGMKCSNH